MKTAYQRYLLSAALVAALALATTTSPAEQGGSGHYTPGATADFIDATPGQPGWVFYNAFMDYDDGTASASRGLPLGANIALSATVNAQADCPLVFYTPDFRILDNGLMTFGVTVPYVWVDVKAGGTINALGHQVSRTREDTASGLGDIEFWPFWLGWTNGDFKYDAHCGVYAPTGDYNKNSLASVGLGYWTFEPEVECSWLSSKLGTEVSVFTGFDINTKNTDANYLSGDIFHIDGTVAQHLPLFGGYIGVGANAFYYKQIDGDSGSGARLGGFETETYGVGPVISYVHKIGKTDLVIDAKWLPQLHADDTTKGNYFYVKVALQF